MAVPRVHLTEKTSVPLFAILGLFFTIATGVAGHFMWVAAISTKSDVAQAKNLDQDERINRLSTFTQTQLSEQSRLLKEVNDRTTRTETMVEVIYNRKR